MLCYDMLCYVCMFTYIYIYNIHPPVSSACPFWFVPRGSFSNLRGHSHRYVVPPAGRLPTARVSVDLSLWSPELGLVAQKGAQKSQGLALEGLFKERKQLPMRWLPLVLWASLVSEIGVPADRKGVQL